jgi:hypothetical protein
MRVSLAIAAFLLPCLSVAQASTVTEEEITAHKWCVSDYFGYYRLDFRSGFLHAYVVELYNNDKVKYLVGAGTWSLTSEGGQTILTRQRSGTSTPLQQVLTKSSDQKTLGLKSETSKWSSELIPCDDAPVFVKKSFDG